MKTKYIWLALTVLACIAVVLFAMNDRWLPGWYVRHDLLWTAPPPTPASTFTHPDYGFTMTVPANMKMHFQQYKTFSPPYDSMWLSYPHEPCPPNADCWWPGISISIREVNPPQAFVDILLSKGVDRDAVLDISKYSNRDGWIFYSEQVVPYLDSTFAYSIRDSILVEIGNNSLGKETKLIVDSLQLPAMPPHSPTPLPTTVRIGEEITVSGSITDLKNDLPVDGNATVTVRTSDGRTIEVEYAQG